MSIRLIAQELYRLEKEVERLEKALQDASVDERPAFEENLRKMRAERNHVRAMLEGSKDDPSCRRPL